uniref:Amidohydrolase n=1 Tax=Solibacter usitatus (strain Ellin6076) TaxID=234267 RepID=Q01RZ2_SOLUE
MRLLSGLLLPALLLAQDAPTERGAFTLHLILHAIGEERYEITRASDASVRLHVTSEQSDRGTRRTVTASLQLTRDFSPVRYDLNSRTASSVVADAGGSVTIREDDRERTLSAPPRYFVGFGIAPFSVQLLMLRYWLAHGKPARLPILRTATDAPAARIEFAGTDSIRLAGKSVRLDRYTIAELQFGREIVWLDAAGNLAAAMTFAGGLPVEAIRAGYEPAFDQLVRAGVAEQMRILAALEREVPPLRAGAFAIAGATLFDATGRAPVPDSVVILREGRIAAAGLRADVAIPKGMPVIDASGKTLLPGLWEMHTHYSGVEFGPAYLAAGVTTARDCGGEFDFLVAARDTIARRHALGPRLLLAGLVDAGGPTGFGAVFADTPEQAKAVVARYHDAGFEQIKLYTYLKPEIIAVLTAEAHRAGMTVTGHVPAALNAIQGVEAGMDQINHLNYVSRVLREPGAIEFFKDHHTVVDPTAGWGEMSGHTKDLEVATFEPGISKAPYSLFSKFTAMGAAAAVSAAFQTRMADTLKTIGALYRGGVTLVPGSDTGLVGYGLHRELELYVQAGMTPADAIRAATIVSARAMKLDADSGTIEPGKRADLILVDGNPLERIEDLRKVSHVVSDGRLFDTAPLWRSVGFRP